MKIDRDFGIPLPDGTRLSAKVWMPDSATLEPVPAVLEYLPYRKSDGTAARDTTVHPVFAEHGYACLRVDRRGCGDSEGLFDDEYSEQELRDGVEVINWIAAQPWCNGNVGMQGISWGGFNGLQLAARAPGALKAVISIGTTVDRYHDDIHYKGGIQLGENIGWAATAMSWLSTPPDPELVGGNKWRDMWLDRLEHTPFLAERWTGHSDRDAYWEHGSVCEEYGDIKAAVLVMGGMHDGYRNAMAALVENLDAPVQGIVGPWSHKYPHISTIEPSIDYHGVASRWWDRWLKEIPNGAEDDGAYRAYVMDSVAPDPSLSERPGKWVVSDSGPEAATTPEILPLGQGVLGEKGAFSGLVETELLCGMTSGEFFPFGFGPGELPDDQQHDDALSLCFDSESVETDKVILGAPSVQLRVASDNARGQVIVRLCDLRPDGTSALISLGMLDLRYRDGFEAKVDLVPDQEYDIVVPLDQSAYRLPAGHRLRLAVSGSYWPFCWPEGNEFTLTVTAGNLSLPVCSDDLAECEFDSPRKTPIADIKLLIDGAERKNWSTDPESGKSVLEIFGDHGRQEDAETGLITGSTVSERWEINPDDPASAKVEIIWTRSLGRGDWEVSTQITARMRGTADSFLIEQKIEAWEGEIPVFEKQFEATVPR